MAGAATFALYRARLRPWMYTWGATDDEVFAALPGDELFAARTPRTTRALTIDAPPSAVWPWLVQLGEGRGGFYSYDVLERLVGTRIHNADAVRPEWQDVHVGDTVWLAQRYGERARMVVAAMEPETYLMLMSPSDFALVQRGEQASGSWSFHLRPVAAGTRLLVRGAGGAVGHAAFDIPHFVMEQKMMRGLRSRAQRRRAPATTPTPPASTPAPASVAPEDSSAEFGSVPGTNSTPGTNSMSGTQSPATPGGAK
jgi:hypothetical protein